MIDDNCKDQPAGTLRLGIQLTYAKQNGRESVVLIEPYDAHLMTTNRAVDIARAIDSLRNDSSYPKSNGCVPVVTADELSELVTAFEGAVPYASADELQVSDADKIVASLDKIASMLDLLGADIGHINDNLSIIVRQGGV